MENTDYIIDNSVIEANIHKVRQGIDVPIYVNFTTWVKRDCYVKEMLTHFAKQTVSPTKITCWLSIKEYNHIIPPSIQECLDSKLIDEIRWVKGNTYCHKRWEAVKYYSDGYIIMIDDDLYYPTDYIEKLIAYSLSYPNAVTCYYTRKLDFINGDCSVIPYTGDASLKNSFLSGLSCFSPHSYPSRALRHPLKRRIFCEKCDDAWIKAWLLRYKIPIVGCNAWRDDCLNPIENTQDDGIYETVNSAIINGVGKEYYNLVDAIVCAGATSVAEQIWPEINIKRFRTTTGQVLKSFRIKRRIRKFIKRILKSCFGFIWKAD